MNEVYLHFFNYSILNTSSYLCNIESILGKISGSVLCGCCFPGVAGRTLALVPILSAGTIRIRATANFAKFICEQAYLRYRGASSPVVVRSHLLGELLAAGKCSRVIFKW